MLVITPRVGRDIGAVAVAGPERVVSPRQVSRASRQPSRNGGVGRGVLPRFRAVPGYSVLKEALGGRRPRARRRSRWDFAATPPTASCPCPVPFGAPRTCRRHTRTTHGRGRARLDRASTEPGAVQRVPHRPADTTRAHNTPTRDRAP